MSLTFTIPGALPSLNEVIDKNRGNIHAGRQLKRETQATVTYALLAAGKHIFTLPVHVSIDWYEGSKRRDPDNVFSAVKFILDALVESGVLADDGQDEIRSITHRLHLDRENPRVVVRLSVDNPDSLSELSVRLFEISHRIERFNDVLPQHMTELYAVRDDLVALANR